MSGSEKADRLARFLLWSPALLVGLAVAASIVAFPQLPERMPTHWGLHGRPTNLAPRGFAAFVLPGFMLYIWFLMAGIAWSMRHTREGRAVPAWKMSSVVAGTVALMLAMHLSLLAYGLGWEVPIPLVANLGVGALFAGLGYVMRDVPPNAMFGVRTPTTLRDEDAWREANRVGGWGMVAAGLATMLAAPLPGAWPLIVMIGAPLAACGAGVGAARRAAQPEPQDG